MHNSNCSTFQYISANLLFSNKKLNGKMYQTGVWSLKGPKKKNNKKKVLCSHFWQNEVKKTPTTWATVLCHCEASNRMFSEGRKLPPSSKCQKVSSAAGCIKDKERLEKSQTGTEVDILWNGIGPNFHIKVRADRVAKQQNAPVVHQMQKKKKKKITHGLLWLKMTSVYISGNISNQMVSTWFFKKSNTAHMT